MAQPSILPEEYARRVGFIRKALADGYAPPGTPVGNKKAALAMAAEASGMHRATMANWFMNLPENEKHTILTERADRPVFDELPDADIPVDDILDHMEKRFIKRAARDAATHEQSIGLPEAAPYGILFFGDPHIDDNGCNIALLRRHVAIAKQPGIYGFQVGDLSNNWPEKLAKLWANQDTSADTAWRLVDWFLNGSGVTWLAHIIGNHDRWNNGGRIIKGMAGKVPVVDWAGRFTVKCKRGSILIDAEHGRKGRSMWNEMHGATRSAVMAMDADIFVSGHTHTFGVWDREVAMRKYSTWLVQTRGYKWLDEYARHGGFAVYSRGAAVLAVIDHANESGPVHCFADVERGAEYLAWLRAR